MKVNRAYTPSNMLATASHLTGQKFKRGEYIKAAEALDALAARTLAYRGRGHQRLSQAGRGFGPSQTWLIFPARLLRLTNCLTAWKKTLTY
jgi:hypothetical protein